MLNDDQESGLLFSKKFIIIGCVVILIAGILYYISEKNTDKNNKNQNQEIEYLDDIEPVKNSDV